MSGAQHTNSGRKIYAPELTVYMEKKLRLKLNKNRTMEGVLRGYDNFMNIVLDEAVEIVAPKDADEEPQRHDCGMAVVRGASIISIQCLENI
ncbi:MAG: hypothetical protein MHM6MM_007004 [Cercozoa sp. M6MM]